MVRRAPAVAGMRAGKCYFEYTSSGSRKSKNPTQDFLADGLVGPVQLFPLLKE